jgi:capsular exopolysaccharide synthesis family protein
MEPLDYLKIVQRHWKVAAGVIIVALVAVFVFSPDSSKVYEAEHVLLRDQLSSSGGNEDSLSSTDNVEVVANHMVRTGEVPARVAEQLGFEGTPEELVADVTAVGDVALGTVTITAAADNREDAALLVNTFGDQLLAFLDQREANQLQADLEEARAEEQQLQSQIRALAPRIQAGGPDGVLAQAEADALANQISALDTEQRESHGTRYVTLERATAGTARLQDDFVAGASRAQRMVLAGIVAALLAFGVAIMLDRSDQRLHTKQEAERQFGLPVLTEVPLLPVRARHRAAVHSYQNDPRMAEAYRSLRTALLLFRDRLPLELEAAELAGSHHGKHSSAARQIIVVTSPDAGDGKSTTAANLAMAYAEAGQRVLLVQWDLWRPLPARVLGADDGPGVAEFLEAGTAPLVRFVQETSIPGLQLVAAGRTGHQPGGQLDSELRLLEEARSLADVVIVDTAPILSASVTRELVSMADVVVLTCRAGRTSSPAAQRCAELLERLGAPTLGVVLVGVPTGPFTDYYGAPATNGRGARARGSVLDRRGDYQPVSSAEHGQASGRRHYRYEAPGRDDGYQ